MADVIGYEEKKNETLSRLKSGYPRFVVHPLLKEIESHWLRLFDLQDCSVWLTSSEKMAKRLQGHLGEISSKFLKHRGVSGLRIPSTDEANTAAKGFLQHIGGFLSSRQAEDYLVLEGLRPSISLEQVQNENAAGTVLDILQPTLGVAGESITLANTGMNAFYAAFEAVQKIQKQAGRSSWVKLGWLYTDTMHILDKLSGEHAENIEALDVFDLDTLEKTLDESGHRIAGIVTEAPTNPLIQTMDLERIRELATKHGIILIIDPTVASSANIDVSPYADIIVTSLTKYAGNEGDVMAGAIAVHDRCPQQQNILQHIAESAEPPYERDLSRLAYQVSGYKKIIEKSNATALKVVDFLESHPKVKAVHWARSEKSEANFKRIARSDEAVGGLISFEYDGPLTRFFDAVPLPKGPSFGMNTTLICPYVYLAHYGLVTSSDGQALLAEAGINPELLRLSFGLEPADEIIDALRKGLES